MSCSLLSDPRSLSLGDGVPNKEATGNGEGEKVTPGRSELVPEKSKLPRGCEPKATLWAGAGGSANHDGGGAGDEANPNCGWTDNVSVDESSTKEPAGLVDALGLGLGALDLGLVADCLTGAVSAGAGIGDSALAPADRKASVSQSSGGSGWNDPVINCVPGLSSIHVSAPLTKLSSCTPCAFS